MLILPAMLYNGGAVYPGTEENRQRQGALILIEKLYEMKAFSALGARNFRIFILGQTVSLIGTWMQRLAMSWLVLRLTGSAAGIGLIELSNQAPILVTGFLAGSILDRYNMKTILLVTQGLCLVQALAIALLDLSGAVRYSQVLMLSLMLGIVASVDLPARQACVTRMLDRPDQLNSALTMNSVIFNLARLIGPALAGFALQMVGEAACFMLNAVSFMAVIYSLTKLNIRHVPQKSRMSGWRSFREGVSYTMEFQLLRRIIMLMSIGSFMWFPYMTLLPYFAKNYFSGSASTLGIFLGSVGLGAIIGVVYQATFVPVSRLHRNIIICLAACGAGLTLFACSRSVELSCAALVIYGFGMSSGSVCFNTLTQSIIDEDKRGRVMSIYTVGNIGVGPLGSLSAGIITDAAGGTVSGLIFGIGLIGLSYYVYRNILSIERPVLKILEEKALTASL